MQHAKLEADAVALDLQAELQRLAQHTRATDAQCQQLTHQLHTARADGTRLETRCHEQERAAADGAEAVASLAREREQVAEVQRSAAAAAEGHAAERERLLAAVHTAVGDREAAEQRCGLKDGAGRGGASMGDSQTPRAGTRPTQEDARPAPGKDADA